MLASRVLFPTLANFIFHMICNIFTYVLGKQDGDKPSFKLWCKRCCSYILPHFSTSIIILTNVVFLYALLEDVQLEMSGNIYSFIFVLSTFFFPLSRGQVVVPEKFLRSAIKGLDCCSYILSLSLPVLISNRWCNAAPENEWNKALVHGLTIGKGDISPDKVYAAL